MDLIILTRNTFKDYSHRPLPLLAEFGAAWCGSCHRVSRLLNKVAEERADVIVGSCDVDDYPEFLTEYNFNVLPTLILFKDGKELGRMTDPAKKEDIIEFVDRLCDGKETK